MENKDMPISQTAYQWILEKWPKLIEMYSSDDVFNADEMGLQISCVA